MNISNPLPVPIQTYLLDCADYLISEVSILDTPVPLMAYGACANAWQLPFVPSIVPISTHITRWAIALAYAIGAVPVVPWNIYVPNQSRYFGSVADYGDLFDFVRNASEYFDPYDGMAEVALVFSENTASANTIDAAVSMCLESGVTFRFVVLRADGSVTGKDSVAPGPLLTVAVGCSTFDAQMIFPDVPVLSLSDVKASRSWTDQLFRVATPDQRNIVAVPRIGKKKDTLLVHIVDTRQSIMTLDAGDHLTLIVPPKHQRLVENCTGVRVIGLGGLVRQQEAMLTRVGNDIILRVSLAGIARWGVILFKAGV